MRHTSYWDGERFPDGGFTVDACSCWMCLARDRVWDAVGVDLLGMLMSDGEKWLDEMLSRRITTDDIRKKIAVAFTRSGRNHKSAEER